MQKTLDTPMGCIGLRHDTFTTCRVRVYEAPYRPAVVIFTQLPSNEGTSVTNLIELLALTAWVFLEKPARGAIWIEHYPSGSDIREKETWNRVEFTTEGDRFAHSVQRADVEALIGQPVETVPA